MTSLLTFAPSPVLRRFTVICSILALVHGASAGTPGQLVSLSLESGSGLVGFAPLPLSPTFSPDTYSYSVSIPFEHDSVEVVSAPASPDFESRVSPPASFPAGAVTVLTIDILEKGDAFGFPVATYTVNVSRGAPNATASLANLVVPGVPITPSFNPLTFSYSATVGFPTDSIVVTPTAADGDSTITVDGDMVDSASSSSPIALGIGQTQVIVLVTSADESVTKGYEVIFTRLEEDSDNDNMDDFWEYQNGLDIDVNDSLLDKDLDGLTNLLEYAFGSDPCDPADAAYPELALDGSGFGILSFHQAVTDGSLIYTPQVAEPGPDPAWSNDFVDLTPGGTPQNQVWRDNAGGSGIPPARRWFRVDVSPTP